MKTLRICFFLALLIATAGCTKKNSLNSELQKSSHMDYRTEEASTVNDIASAGSSSSANVSATNVVEPKIIRTASLSIEVNDYQLARAKIDSIITLNKGYIVSESFQETDTQKGNSISIRVPSQNFDNLLKNLAESAKRVDYQNIYAQDVTEEYIDVKTRLNNKLQLEKTYLSLLRKAQNMDDILKIENKLAEIRSEIESEQGRLNYIDHQVNLSLISLYVYQKIDYKFIPKQLPGFWQRIKEGFHWGWRGLLWFAILLVKLWPLWLLSTIAIISYKKIKSWLKNRKKKEKKEKKQQKKNKETDGLQQ